MKSLLDQGVEEAYIMLLEDTHKYSTGTIILHKQNEKIAITKGVRHEGTITPKLFSATLESVFKKLDREKFGVRVNG